MKIYFLINFLAAGCKEISINPGAELSDSFVIALEFYLKVQWFSTELPFFSYKKDVWI